MDQFQMGLLCFISGIISVLLREKVTRNMKEEKGEWTKEERKNRMLIGGIMFIIGGILLMVTSI
jgi:UPF0716 family protein affecting phage T7 exclusion